LITLPDPSAFAHEPPPTTEQLHATPVTAAGTVSDTDAPTTFDGPLFATVTVYEIGLPGTADTAPSDFVTAKSLERTTVSVSVAELFPALGSVVPAGTAAEAVFAKLPLAPADSVPDTV
jgi:hypothetical protein